MKHVLIDYYIYEMLKNNFNLAKGYSQFKNEDMDQGMMFFDENMNFIDQDRLKIENIEIHKVLLPRFLFLQNLDKLENLRVGEHNEIGFTDFFKDEEDNINKYKINDNQKQRLNEIRKFL